MDWIEKDNALHKTFVFENFMDAMVWMYDLASYIDEYNHHPEWTNIYNKVHVTLTTHDAGSVVTKKDRDIADMMDKTYQLFV